MEYSKSNKGFTLIELMVVVAIISILVAVTLPIYQSYVARASINSCLSEAKNYSNDVFYRINDQDIATVPSSPKLRACQSITDATGWTLLTQTLIIATPKSSTARIECNLSQGASCKVVS